MIHYLDPEAGIALARIGEARKLLPAPELHDVDTRRKNFASLMQSLPTPPQPEDISFTKYTTTTADGFELDLYWYHKTSPVASSPGPAIVHAHGGGMILGSVPESHLANSMKVSHTGVPLLSVDYRVAPERPTQTSLVEDCYAGLVWLHAHVTALNVDPARIAVMGESAGGGIMAGVALMARDKGLSPTLAKQIIIYPMLDDRNVNAIETMRPHLIWSWEDNITGWSALLGKDIVGTDKVSPYAAPARATSLEGLPPTYMHIGTLDIFLDENLDYVQRLLKANVPVEFHVYPGVPHGFDGFMPHLKTSQLANEQKIKAMMNF